MLSTRDLGKIGISQDRVKQTENRAPCPGKYVLYWMEASLRERYNSALEYASLAANRLQLPVVVAFGLTDQRLGMNLRHYRFLVESLAVVKKLLAERGIQMAIDIAHPVDFMTRLAKNAAVVVTDCGNLPVQKEWRREDFAESEGRAWAVFLRTMDN